MLRLKNISWKAPDSKEILENINLVIPDNKLAVITGPNGSGKTTLAKIIAGLLVPTTGHILLDEEDITGLDITQRARRGISFAFQQPVRFKGITVRQLVETAAGTPLKEKQLCDILGNVGLCAKDYIDREVNATLSGGEMKRIEIATVLARHSRLSVFDEPEAGIDLWSFQNLITVFQDMQKDLKGSLLIISHQERILRIADEIILLADGCIQDSGPCEKMLEKGLQENNQKSGCCRKEGLFS